MTTSTTDRPFLLHTANQSWRGEAPDLATAIERAEAELGGRVWVGQSMDGGVPQFDSLQDFLDGHRTPGKYQPSKPLPNEAAALDADA